MSFKYQSLFDELRPIVAAKEVQAAPSVTLRPYQLAAVDAVFSEWDAGHTATLVVIPTGGGKSVVFSEVMRRFVEAA